MNYEIHSYETRHSRWKKRFGNFLAWLFLSAGALILMFHIFRYAIYGAW